MKPVFPRIYKAIQFTTDYFEENRIAGCISLLNGDTNFSYLDTYYTATLNFHKQMEDEINQNIYGSNTNIQTDMFEYLKDWVENDWRFSSKWDYKITIDAMVENYNDNAWADYESEIKADEENYKKKVDFSRKHLDEYEKEYPSFYGLGGFHPKRVEKVINGWFYCNEKKPKLINKDLLPEYYKLVDKILSSFRSSCLKYIDRYNNDKIKSSATVLVENSNTKTSIPASNYLPPTVIEPVRKMELNLSVPQVACLFLILRGLKVINEPLNTELARFIKANFSTKGAADISERTLSAQLGSIDTLAIDHWLEELKKIRIILANMKHP